MQEEKDETTTEETQANPTITIAEKDGTATAPAEAKPTITIAEKDGGE